MELPFPAVKCQCQLGGQGRRAEPQVRRDRQPGMDPAQRPQEIIVEAQRQPEGQQDPKQFFHQRISFLREIQAVL